MNYQQELLKKTVSVEEAVDRLASNSCIFAYGLAEPISFFKQLHHLKGKKHGMTLVNSLHAFPYDFYTDDSYRELIHSESIFFARFCSAAQKNGMCSFIPSHLRHGFENKLINNERRGRPYTVYTVVVSPMDAHGYFSSGTVGMSNRMMVEQADLVILEINENMPRTFGNTHIHISEADCVFQGDNTMIYLPRREISKEDAQIGAFISDLIEDGSTLQLGIGTIPNAVAKALQGKKDLGIHTEMLGDGIVDLYKAGAVTNRKKTLYKDRFVASFSYGSKETYAFLDNNPGVLHLEVREVNSPAVIAQNYKMVSVNTTLQVDLMGQCASEAIGTLQISGTGGQTATASGAQLAPGGKSIIALHSTAMVKNAEGGRDRKSTIVGVHPAGTVISLLRADIDYVVTEHGVAALRGASLARRAQELINIAHPDYRDELRADAKKYYLI